MTDRINSLVVVLDKDMREDDVESLCDAIRHLRHVISVKKNVSDLLFTVGCDRAKHELKMKMVDILTED